MNTNKKDTPPNHRPAEEAPKREANMPAPLDNKTDRHFQRQNQEPRDGTTSSRVLEDKPAGSSSGEEKDII